MPPFRSYWIYSAGLALVLEIMLILVSRVAGQRWGKRCSGFRRLLHRRWVVARVAVASDAQVADAAHQLEGLRAGTDEIGNANAANQPSTDSDKK